MLKKHSQVVLKKPLPNLRLEPGDVGVVVRIYAQGAAYEVVVSDHGRTHHRTRNR